MTASGVHIGSFRAAVWAESMEARAGAACWLFAEGGLLGWSEELMRITGIVVLQVPSGSAPKYDRICYCYRVAISFTQRFENCYAIMK